MVHTSVDQEATLDRCVPLQFAMAEFRYRNYCTCVSPTKTSNCKAARQLDTGNKQ